MKKHALATCFLQGAATFALMVATAGIPATAEPLSSLQQNFASPPTETRPRTLYFWMNGNVTAQGINADLTAMRDAGLGGALVFDGSDDVPKGDVDYLSPKWLELMRGMIAKGNELGLSVGMHNAPGWSSSGGPWVTPDKAMQQIVWTETTVTGGHAVSVALSKPYTKYDTYHDAVVLAFPASDGDEATYRDDIASMTIGGHAVDVATMTDHDLHSTLAVAPDAPLVIEMKTPFRAQSVTLYALKETPAFNAKVETSADGKVWTLLADIAIGADRGIEAPGIANFAPVHARFFRITPIRKVQLAEAMFYAAPHIPDWDLKAGHIFQVAGLPKRSDSDLMKRYAIDPAKVIDITQSMDASGKVTWKAPAGRWTIMRFGYPPTG